MSEHFKPPTDDDPMLVPDVDWATTGDSADATNIRAAIDAPSNFLLMSFSSSLTYFISRRVE